MVGMNEQATNPAPNRRWFRFSVWTLVVILPIAAGLLGWRSWEMRERAQLRAEILKSPNAALIRDARGKLSYVDLRSTDFTERDLKRAEAIFPEAHVTRVIPFYWDHRYRNSNPKALRDDGN